MCLSLGAAAIALAAAAVFFFLPEYRGVLWLGLYTITPLPQEPLLLFTAKSYSTTLCALASLAGCLIGGVLDYKILFPIMHHPNVRPRYANVRLYRRLVNLFRRSPFWTVAVAGATPLPFYPVKFLSICDRYPLRRYLAALGVGRAPRYWGIAYLGVVFRFPNWSLLALAGVLLAVSFIQALRERRKDSGSDGAAPVEPRAPTSPLAASARSTQCGK